MADDNLENLLNGYNNVEKFRQVFSRNPSTDNYSLRKQIRDENMQPMYSQPAGLVDMKIEQNLDEVLTELSTRMDADKYKEFTGNYPVSEQFINLIYAELAKREIMPKDASKDLKKVAGMMQQAYELEEAVATKKYEDAVEMLEGISDGDINHQLAYQYNAIGQGQNVSMLAMKYAQMHKRVAASKITNEMRAEIDKAIAESNKNRAIAAVERYKVSLAEKAAKEAEAKSKKK